MAEADLSENHRRSIGVALAGLDELLCTIESWADGREARGVLYLETNDLTRRRREALRGHAREVRTLLLEARDRLGLKTTEVRASGDVWSRCCAIRDMLGELGEKHLKGYGEMPGQLAKYMDHLSATLVDAIDRMSKAAKRDEDSETRLGSNGR